IEAEGEYQVADGNLLLTSPVVGGLSTTLTTTLDTLSDDVNAITGANGALNTLLGGVANDLVGPLTSGLGAVSGGLVDVSNVKLAATIDADLKTALSAVLEEPLTNAEESVVIDLSTGEIVIDIARLVKEE